MGTRKKLPDIVQTNVLVQSRRRCCICFGLQRDESVKKGQIAHLDSNRNNNEPDNLVFLCFDHHEEYDSTTNQSKGLTLSEVQNYREELYAHYGNWRISATRDNFMNFLASSIDLDQISDVAIKVANGIVVKGDEQAYVVLRCSKVDYSDWDLLGPHLIMLDYFASWGWLKYTQEEKESKHGETRTYVTVEHKPICREVANVIRKQIKQGDANITWLDAIDKHADQFTDDRD